MNRRNLLKAIPSISLFSIVPEVDLRKWYLEFVFPSQFCVEKMEINGEKYYSAVLLDPPSNNQYYYYYNTHTEKHKYVVQFLTESGAENLEVRYAETAYRAYKEIEKYLS